MPRDSGLVRLPPVLHPVNRCLVGLSASPGAAVNGRAGCCMVRKAQSPCGPFALAGSLSAAEWSLWLGRRGGSCRFASIVRDLAGEVLVGLFHGWRNVCRYLRLSGDVNCGGLQVQLFWSDDPSGRWVRQPCPQEGMQRIKADRVTR